jgi:hypothetical protein
MEAWFMAADLRALYGLYVDYSTCLRADFDRHLGSSVAERFRPQLLSFDDFCALWRDWGRVESLQETWQRRFVFGYDRVAENLSRGLETALGGAGDGRERGSLDRAA